MRIILKNAPPACPNCRAKGALPLVRTIRRNGGSNESRAQRARLVSSVPLEASHDEEVHAPLVQHGAVASVTPGEDVPTVACPRDARRGRNRNNPNAPPATRSRKARSRRE
jgi:hypothetical protein